MSVPEAVHERPAVRTEGRLAKQLVYICGSGHSGSTLLDMLLGGHERISALGEAHRIFLSANQSSRVHFCACGKRFWECEFWREASLATARLIGSEDPRVIASMPTTDPRHLRHGDDGRYFMPVRMRRVFGDSIADGLMVLGSRVLWRAATAVPAIGLQRRAARNSLTIYEAIRRRWETPVIVDSTKNAGRMKSLFLESPTSLRVTYLIRDGRAVCASRMRRDGCSMEKAASIWRAEHRKLGAALRTVPTRLITRIRYEDVCIDPQRELTRVLSAFGLAFDEEMLRFGSGDRHNIGGNPMRFSMTNASEIRLDERWRRELRAADLETFYAIAGRTQTSLGYETLDECSER